MTDELDANPTLKKHHKLLKQIAGFGIIGAVNTVLSYLIYALFLWLGFHYLVGSIVGYVVTVFHAWLWQYFVIFREGGADADAPWYQSMFKTYASYALTGLILNNLLLILMLDVVHIENFLGVFFEGELFGSNGFLIFSEPRQMAEYIAPILTLLVTIPLNFILNKFWSFGKK